MTHFINESKGIGISAVAGKSNGKTIATGGPTATVPVHDKAESTTKSAVAEGKITITKPEQQKVEELQRNTDNTQNKLGNIFDRETVEERKEMANIFSELAHTAIGNMTLKLSPEQKRILNIAAGAITSYLGSGDYLSGAAGVTVTEAMQKLLKDVKDPAVKEILIGIASTAAGKITNLRVEAVIASALNVERFNHLPHEFQERFTEEISNARNNEEKLQVIEKYYGISQEFRENEPGKAEDMEKAFMEILGEITKYDDCGIKFQINEEQGLHNNLEAAKAFLQLSHYAQYLPEIFEGVVIATAAEIAAPVTIVAGTLKYGPAVYELCTDVIKNNDSALYVDLKKHTFLYIGDFLATKAKVSKYILIPAENSIEVYINIKYKTDSEVDSYE